jgi:nonsense-mediated mRNA decay protein 3
VTGQWICEDIDRVVARAVKKALNINVDETAINTVLEKKSRSNLRAQVEIRESNRTRRLEERFETNVRISWIACDRCSRIAGGYYESKVQIRAQRRPLEDAELKRALRIAESTIEHAQREDRLAFISKTVQLKEGLDIYVGTTRAAKQIVRAMMQQMGGGFNDSAQLVGRRDGKDVYRVTFVVRLPEFPVGSIISCNRRFYEIYSASSTINAVDLETGQRTILKDKDLRRAKLIGARADAKTTILAAIDVDEVHVIDPETYVSLAIKRPQYTLKKDEGKEVKVVKTSDGLLLLP